MATCSPSTSSGNTTNYTSADKTVEAIKPTEIKSVVGGFVRMGVYDVEAKGNGEISVKPAKYTEDTELSSRKYSHRTYTTKGAYIDLGGDSNSYKDDRDATTAKGVNWDNVKAVSGNTYDMKNLLKGKGFKWNGTNKRWEK